MAALEALKKLRQAVSTTIKRPTGNEKEEESELASLMSDDYQLGKYHLRSFSGGIVGPWWVVLRALVARASVFIRHVV
jgi:hypothetical protein